MKHMLVVLSIVLVASSTARGVCAERSGKSCRDCCTTTRWYKAKDGTYREMLPYSKALSRAEDADDLEIKLRGVETELASAHEATEAAKAEAAAVKTTLESQIAELTRQLEVEKQNAQAQSERADNAEAAHKLAIESVAQLRDEAKRQEENLAAVKNELKVVSEERRALEAAAGELKKQSDEMQSALAAAEKARKEAEDELNSLKQAAAESKKSEVEGEKESPSPDSGADGDNSGESGSAADPQAPAAPN